MSTCCVPGALRVETTRRAPIWSLPPSLGLSPAATHLPTGPAFRWARVHPEQAWSPRSSRGCGGFWTPGELTCLSGHSPQPQGRRPYIGASFPREEISTFSHQSPWQTSGSLGPPVWVSEKRSGQRITHLLVSEGLVRGLHLFVFPHRGQDLTP